MSGQEHVAIISWTRGEGDFKRGRYSRLHEWRFDGGVAVPASASPHVVPLPLSSAEAIDPEEAFVAAIASCHMLTFIDIARRAGFVIDRYEDRAIGTVASIAPGRSGVTKVVLRPEIGFAENSPDPDMLADLHHRAHELCFIANSVKTEISIEAPAEAAATLTA